MRLGNDEGRELFRLVAWAGLEGNDAIDVREEQ
jgi:hypothetical protein